MSSNSDVFYYESLLSCSWFTGLPIFMYISTGTVLRLDSVHEMGKGLGR